MAKILLTTEDRLEDALRRSFTQQEIGDLIGKTHGAVSKKLKTMNFTYKELKIIFSHLDADREKIGSFFK